MKHHLILVHGASHGAWCWFKIRILLEALGHRVTCLDLKGSGIDLTDPNTVFTMERYDEPLFQLLSSLDANEKVILVGHSAGGHSVTHAILKFPHKIHLSIYVAASMLKHGFATDQDIKDGCPDLSEYGDVNELMYGLGLDQSPTSVILKKELQRKLLYHMSPEEDSMLASMLLRPAPLRAFQGVQIVDGSEADRVPRVYIKTACDRMLKPEQQDAMIRRWPPSQVMVLESDHSPFFSAHMSLFRFIIQASASIKSY